MSKTGMRLKYCENTILRKNNSQHRKTIEFKDFLKKFNHFFTGQDLEEVLNVESVMKHTFYYLTVTTKSGDYEIKLRKDWDSAANKSTKISLFYGDKITYCYETLGDFACDFQKSSEDDLRILAKYEKQLLNKQKEMSTTTKVLKTIQSQIPEFFL